MSGNATLEPCGTCAFVHDDDCYDQTCTVCRRLKVVIRCTVNEGPKKGSVYHIRTCPNFDCNGCELRDSKVN